MNAFEFETINNKIMTLAAELCVPLTIYQTIDSVDTKLEHPSEFVNKDKLGAYREYLEFIKTHSNKQIVNLFFQYVFKNKQSKQNIKHNIKTNKSHFLQHICSTCFPYLDSVDSRRL